MFPLTIHNNRGEIILLFLFFKKKNQSCVVKDLFVLRHCSLHTLKLQLELTNLLQKSLRNTLQLCYKC